MTWRTRRRGIFEGLPRVVYRRTGARYLDACAVGTVLNGIGVAVFGVVTVALYLDLTAAELAMFGAVFAAVLVVEGIAAALMIRSATVPTRAWLEGGDASREAWAAAGALPVTILRRPSLYVLGAAGAAITALVVASLLDLPTSDAALILPTLLLLYVSSAILRHLALELGMRPLLEALGPAVPATPALPGARLALHARMVVAVPMVTWGGALVVTGLITDNARDLDTLGPASLVAFGVSAAISIWLSLVLADTVSGPIVDLRDATRRVGEGDLTVRVPVVSTDETGELAESFNAMVHGLEERRRLHDAFGAYVDPALTERVLAEGTDLSGEEVDASLLFLDIRGFTSWAERAAAHQVVATLNDLFETVVPVIQRHGGHANKFIGDGLLAVFGAPERHDDHALRAVAAGRELAELVPERLGDRVRVGIGVNTGRVVAGTIGGGGRRDFTVIGDAVNTAARVEAATRDTGDDLLITEATLRELGPLAAAFDERPAAPLRGKAEPVRLYAPR